MSSDDPSARHAAPIVLRIKLRYDDVDAMVQRFATNVGKSGLFLPTKSIQPIGAEIKFELRLADDTPAIVGLGRVKLAKPPDPSNPKATFGMAIELMRVTPQSRALILRMLDQRRALGLPELNLPTPDDIDAARRAEAVAAGVRDPASGPVAAPTQAASGTSPPAVAARPSAPSLGASPPSTGATGPSSNRPSAPSLAASVAQGGSSGSLSSPSIALPLAASDAHPGEALLTAPRRTTGPLSIAKVLGVAPLAPEPPRRKRLAVSEIIESASGPVASVAIADPGLEDGVDVAAALARARSLAGGAVDAELDALAEAAAVPLEISIDAASAELAKQLGGSAVRRDRSARWAPPPATKLPSTQDAAAAHPADAGDAADVEQAADAGDAADVEQAARGVEQAAGAGEEAARAGDRATDGDDARDAVSGDGAGADHGADVARADAGDAVDAADAADADDEEEAVPLLARASGQRDDARPAQVDAIHSLSELDMEDVEHTELGGIPVAASFDPQTEGVPVDEAQLGERLDEQLAEAEADAENLELARALGIAAHGDPAAAYERRDELGLRADSAVDVNLDEIDDFEILAEADANDEDLLAAHGEQAASDGDEQDASDGDEIAQQPTGVRRPSGYDFSARLDLGEDSDLYYAVPDGDLGVPGAIDRLHDEFADRHVHLDSANQALAAFDEETGDELAPARSDHNAVVEPIFEPELTSSSFTIAGTPSDVLDIEPSAAIPPPIASPTPIAPTRPSSPASGSSRGVPTHAGAPQPAAPRPRATPSSPTATGTPQPARTPSGPIRKQPSTLRNSPFLPSLLDSPVEDHELESALEALDVDLDDLAIPHAATELQRDYDPSRPRPTTTIRPASHSREPQFPHRAPQAQPQFQPRPAPPSPGAQRPSSPGAAAPAPPAGRAGPPRATSEDGVIIDFDDDD